ncbi:YeeE/YedE thiosulfate transporter family protein [Caminicella sporogenes]|uniref:YeeE/YedE thiosulfate transporter family protein n=1 Tax=Caminicella sporogenes TaxID=166485 RepID=UPI0025402C33|nr:YeeE/YedE thiosulfate transporter family protein [Caminicella sporogenes]WIF94057.1 YeeE/YedE thiosulfate transporter family protein [Caminicella sporogenes]
MTLYKKVFKKPWSYIIGGIMLALLNVILLITTGNTWEITTGFLYWGVWFLQLFGIDISSWYYFSVYNNGLDRKQTFLNNSYTVINLAVIFGALISSLLASEFKLKKIKNKRQLIFGLVGGVMMGYGSRIAFGCNTGAYFSAIPSFSLHGWVFAVFLFIGAWMGSKILFKYLL